MKLYMNFGCVLIVNLSTGYQQYEILQDIDSIRIVEYCR